MKYVGTFVKTWNWNRKYIYLGGNVNCATKFFFQISMKFLRREQLQNSKKTYLHWAYIKIKANAKYKSKNWLTKYYDKKCLFSQIYFCVKLVKKERADRTLDRLRRLLSDCLSWANWVIDSRQGIIVWTSRIASV